VAEKNKPCPKCNSLIYRVVKVSGWFRLECGCGIMFNPFVNTEAEMWQKWNNRPQIKETKLTTDNKQMDAIALVRKLADNVLDNDVAHEDFNRMLERIEQQHH